MINNIKNSRININTNDIQILDFNKDWKLIRSNYPGEAKTIYSKEEADNMRLLYAEYTEEQKNIILAGSTDDNYIIKKLNINGYVSDSYKWEKANGVKSPIYRIDEGIYGIDIRNGFQIWSENKDIPQDINYYLREIFTWDLSELGNATHTKIGNIVKGKYFDVDISYGSTDTLHAMCSLESESKLKYFPYITSERTQEVIELADKMLYLGGLFGSFKNDPYAEELANAIKEDKEKQEEKASKAKQLLLTKINETKKLI